MTSEEQANLLLGGVRRLALSYPDTAEIFSWKYFNYYRQLKGRNFLFANAPKDVLEVLFKVPLGERDTALELPFVQVYPSMGHKGWLIAKIKLPEELEKIIPFTRLSYEMSQPFRGKNDTVPGELPEILDFLEQVRNVALSFGEVEEYFPHGERAFKRVKGKIFLYAEEYLDCLYVCVLLPMGVREYAQSLPFVEIPKYIGASGWLAAKVKTQAELATVLAWVELSFDMTAK
jgi:hypothetical protein